MHAYCTHKNTHTHTKGNIKVTSRSAGRPHPPPVLLSPKGERRRMWLRRSYVKEKGRAARSALRVPICVLSPDRRMDGRVVVEGEGGPSNELSPTTGSCCSRKVQQVGIWREWATVLPAGRTWRRSTPRRLWTLEKEATQDVSKRAKTTTVVLKTLRRCEKRNANIINVIISKFHKPVFYSQWNVVNTSNILFNEIGPFWKKYYTDQNYKPK